MIQSEKCGRSSNDHPRGCFRLGVHNPFLRLSLETALLRRMGNGQGEACDTSTGTPGAGPRRYRTSYHGLVSLGVGSFSVHDRDRDTPDVRLYTTRGATSHQRLPWTHELGVVIYTARLDHRWLDKSIGDIMDTRKTVLLPSEPPGFISKVGAHVVDQRVRADDVAFRVCALLFRPDFPTSLIMCLSNSGDDNLFTNYSACLAAIHRSHAANTVGSFRQEALKHKLTTVIGDAAE